MKGASMTDKFNWAEYTDEVDYATYSPEDDKIRIYSGRVPREMYDALREAKFNRAYKQGCFYAKWYPYTEDIALALCSEITDEDTSLFDRAEDRAGRFAGYSSNAEKRAEQAVKAGNDAVNGIPMGQPILVGHHSERAHRKALERSQREAMKVVEEVNRRDYWSSRASGVLRHADYKVQRGPTMRRIKKLESDRRKQVSQREGKDYDQALTWRVSDLAKEYSDEFEQAEVTTWQGHAKVATLWAMRHELPDGMPKTEANLQKWQEGRKRYCNRWIAHLEGQILFWKTLLQDEHGEDVDEQMPLKKGCWIHCKYGWAQVVRVNKGAEKRITSVSVDPETATWNKGGWFYPRKVSYETIKEWSETEPGETPAKVNPTPHATLKEPDPLRAEAEAQAKIAAKTEIKVNHNPDFYPTPLDVVDRMLNEAAPWLNNGRLMLEPSAGDGRIIQHALGRWPCIEAHWYEVNCTAQEVLRSNRLGGFQYGDDFLAADPKPIYDAVVMNPPFSRNQYRKHVWHAYRFVKPGGILVTLLPNGAFWQNDGDKFKQWLDAQGAVDIELPHGTFEDTEIATRIVTIKK